MTPPPIQWVIFYTCDIPSFTEHPNKSVIITIPLKQELEGQHLSVTQTLVTSGVITLCLINAAK